MDRRKAGNGGPWRISLCLLWPLRQRLPHGSYFRQPKGQISESRPAPLRQVLQMCKSLSQRSITSGKRKTVWTIRKLWFWPKKNLSWFKIGGYFPAVNGKAFGSFWKIIWKTKRRFHSFVYSGSVNFLFYSLLSSFSAAGTVHTSFPHTLSIRHISPSLISYLTIFYLCFFDFSWLNYLSSHIIFMRWWRWSGKLKHSF